MSNLKRKIYLDNQATTPVDPRVLTAMLPWFTEKFGNAASRSHAYGWEAEEAVDMAREQVANLIGASPQEIIFTSGATEADNLALFGAARFRRCEGKHLITLRTEHKAVLDPCGFLAKQGWDVTILDVQKDGLIDLQRLEDSIRPETILISIMHAHNEIGVIQPLYEIGELCKKRGIWFHVDGAQAVGKIPVDVKNLGIDLYALSAHKMYGPKGVGALYVRRRNPRIQLEPLLYGGGHERGFRSGTLPVPLIVGFGEAAAICQEVMEAESVRLRDLRDDLFAGLQDNLIDFQINGSFINRLPNNLNVSFFGVNGEALLMGLSSLAVSSGSACTSSAMAPSYVLKALGLDDDLAFASLRFGIGRFNTSGEIQIAVNSVCNSVDRLRRISRR